ncbi:hypothetical protein NDU88_003932 [Pleurodeles waltl]|uniref:Uncharacterized protein n=1 Tax=Pleurodeles waltl TaxID=8319 RepID=A0AAV7NI33_PLEWA|nr:hypothetical protein NDU88_003932 [Pleurodeles waltl]
MPIRLRPFSLTDLSHQSIRGGLQGRQIKIQVYPGRRIFTSKKRLSPKVKISTEDSRIAYPEKGSRRSDWTGRFVLLKKIFEKETKALILTLAGGGGRPPKSRRQVTVPRSKDRGGNSDFPAGLAGGLVQTASQPSGKEASTMKPARNRAGGVEAVRRVQLHPSRISLSAQQTVKYM